MQPRQIYLVSRNPALSAEEFRREWRKHAKLAAQFPAVSAPYTRIAQCLNARSPQVWPGSSQDFDGLNLLDVTSLQAVRSIWKLPEVIETMVPDERRVFSDCVENTSLLALAEVLHDGPQGTVGVLELVRRSDNLTAEAFTQNLRDCERASSVADRGRLVLNQVQGTPPTAFSYDAIIERWLSGPEEARELAQSPQWHAHSEQRKQLIRHEKTMTLLVTLVYEYRRPS